MTVFIMLLVSLAPCYKWGDWRNWKLYYPTLLFYLCGSLIENIITNNTHLWLFYGSYSADLLTDILFDFLLLPCVEILFLSNYPKGKLKQIFYYLAFLAAMSIFELVLFLSGEIKYYGSWNVVWSILVYAGIFPLLRIHFKKPLLAWLILFLFIAGGMFYFKIPLESL